MCQRRAAAGCGVDAKLAVVLAVDAPCFHSLVSLRSFSMKYLEDHSDRKMPLPLEARFWRLQASL